MDITVLVVESPVATPSQASTEKNSEQSDFSKNFTPETENTCGTCRKKLSSRSALTRHKKIHGGKRPYVCPYVGCIRTFIQRSALTVHSRVHSGAKPYHCDMCSAKPFSDPSSIARHKRNLHPKERPYKCSYADCSAAFATPEQLRRHQTQERHSSTSTKIGFTPRLLNEAQQPTMSAASLEAFNKCPLRSTTTSFHYTAPSNVHNST